MLNIALPKGRLGEKVYAMFEAAGFECPSIRENNRKLIFENPEKQVRYFWVKPSDVAIYVERGAADIGVAGKDILLEYEPDVYELWIWDLESAAWRWQLRRDSMTTASGRCGWRRSLPTSPRITMQAGAGRSTSSSSTARLRSRRF